MEMEEKESEQLMSFEEVSGPYLLLLRLVGLLPFEARQGGCMCSRALLLYFVLSSFINVSMYTCFCLNSKEVGLDAIAETVIVLGANSRFYLMIWRRRGLRSMLRECASLWSLCSQQGRQCVRHFERKLRAFLRLFFVSCCFINVLYPANALLSLRGQGASANSSTTHRILPYKWYADNTENHWPGYWRTFLLQMLVVQNTVITSTISDAVLPFMMILAAGYFRHLADRLLENSAAVESPGQRFVRCSAFHQRILAFCSKLERFTRLFVLSQLLSTGYNISLILFKIVSRDPDKYKYLSIMAVCFCQLFLVQWSPDQLFDQSLAVATAAYFNSLHCMPLRMGKHLLIVMARAQRPVQITAGGFINLSLQSFGSMLTSAFSFFNVLRNMDL